MQAALSEQVEGLMHQPPYHQTDPAALSEQAALAEQAEGLKHQTQAALSEQAEGLQDVPQADLVALEHAGWGAHE